MHKILIIGTGRVGTSLFRALSELSSLQISLYTKKPIPKLDLVKFEAGNLISEPDELMPGKYDLIVICVQDDLIFSAVDLLLQDDVSGAKVVHTSGVNDGSILERLQNKGALTGSWHPVQTFKDKFEHPNIWKDIVCTYEGSTPLVNEVKQLTKALGSVFLPVTSAQKKSIHLAAVVSANFQVGLLSWANHILKEANLSEDTGKKLLAPLIDRTIKNFKEQPLHTILTGPLVRGDTNSILNHIDILEKSSLQGVQDLYKKLGIFILNDPEFRFKNKIDLEKILNL